MLDFLKTLFTKKSAPVPGDPEPAEASEPKAEAPAASLSEEETGELFIDPEDYFLNYLAFPALVPSGGNAPARNGFDSYAAMGRERLQREAERGVPGALQELGERFLFGFDGKQDPVQAQALFLRAAELGHPEGLHMLSEMRRSENFGCQDMDDYFVWLRRASDRGCCLSMYNLFCAYHNGKERYDGHGVERNPAKAFELGKKTIAQTEALIRVILAHPTTGNFEDYINRLCTVWNNAVKLTAHQALEGDGTERNLGKTIEILESAQQFHEKTFDCMNFGVTSLLEKCREMQSAEASE